MAYTTIDKSSLHFNTKLYTGNGGTNALTGVGFQPDMVWMKSRTNNTDHAITDVVRGVTKEIRPNKTDYEDTASNGLTAFGADGFTLGDWTVVNLNSETYASWNWKAGGGQGSSNTDGTINTTYTSANTTAGTSIIKYTGTGSAATVGHGLGAVPKMMLVKKTSGSESWGVYHHSIGNTKFLQLNTNGAEGTSSAFWNNTTPTSSVFSIGTENGVNQSGQTYIAYCFAEKQGFSKFGSYTGNGNANGPFIYTGFKPAWLMIKRTNSTASWVIVDNQRLNNFNPQDRLLFSDNSDTEDGSGETYYWDFLSNGIKIRTTSGSYGNGSNDTYAYMAFAEAPLVGSNNQPANAR